LPGSRNAVSTRRASGAVNAFDAGILPGVAGLDVFQPDALRLNPCRHLATAVFETILNSNGVWIADQRSGGKLQHVHLVTAYLIETPFGSLAKARPTLEE